MDADRVYHQGARRFQDRFDTRRLADRLVDVNVHVELTDEDREFVERMDMFFMATADADGRLQCSYKGGAPGFVRVLDPRTLAFPSYDGNGMFMTLGNLAVNPEVGLLFIDFTAKVPHRLRVNGTASVDVDDPLLPQWPEAQVVVRVRPREIFPACPRYIHRMKLVEHSRFVPRVDRETPVPTWKRAEWARDVLPEGDPAHDPERPVGL